MKKYLLGAVLLLAVAFGGSNIAHAALTQAQINSILAQIKVLQQLLIDNNQNSGDSFCYDFNSDFGIGNSGASVQSLSRVFAREGLGDDNENYFSENTASKLIRFQAKYGIKNTGYAGPLTRARLNALYGCRGGVMPVPTPAPTPVASVTIKSINGIRYSNINWTDGIQVDQNDLIDIRGSGLQNSYVYLDGEKLSASVIMNSSDGSRLYFGVEDSGLTMGRHTLNLSQESRYSGKGYDVPIVVVNADQPSIALLSPNGGQTYVNDNSVITIDYRSTNIVGEKIVAFLYNPVNGNVRQTATAYAENSGRLFIDLGKGSSSDSPAPGQYKINICAPDVDKPGQPGKSLCDISDEYFMINAPSREVTCNLTTDKSSYTIDDIITYSWTSQNATYAAFVQDTSGKDHFWLPGDKLRANGSQRITASVVGNPTVTLLVGGYSGSGSCSTTVHVDYSQSI